MATIELIHKRVGNDIQMAVQVLDNGDPISWSEVTALHALLTSDSQRVRLGSCSVDGALPQDATTMMLTYSGKSPQYLGVARLVLIFRYRNHQCALDAPVLCFVSSTSEEGVGPVEVYIPADVDPEVNSLQIVVGGGGSASWGTITGNITNQTDLIALLGEKQDKIEDLQDIREGAAAGATALQSETDPTVPAWAKAENKPSYTYSEISETPDLSAFITKTVNDLVNYYTKSETYTREEVVALIAQIQGMEFVPVQTLPTASADTLGKIYLVPAANPQAANQVDEYYTQDNGSGASPRYTWELFGSAALDLSGYVTTTALNTALASYTTTANLAAVATSGSYNDLTNKPTIPAAQVNADWNAASGVAQILNKPTIPAAQIQSDWNQTDNTAKDYIKNKPTIPSGVTVDQVYDATSANAQSGLAMAGALAGKEDTISDLATIRSGAALGATAVQPGSLATVATTGDYDDLSNKPTIPTVPTDVVKYSAQTLTEVQKAQARTNIGSVSTADLASLQSEQYVEVASLPTASASTLGKIYLVGPDAYGNYERYITSYDGNAYTWVSIGDTSISLNDYMQKGNVEEDGLYFVDFNMNVGAKIVQGGFFSINGINITDF